MHSIICPSVTPSSDDPHVYREQIERVSFAPRVHVDLMDGVFTSTKNMNPIQLWWPEKIEIDIHLMFEQPQEHLETLISLSPKSIILHAEAQGDIARYLEHIKKFGIKAGVALLPETSIESAFDCIEIADQVMIFSGNLGKFGGTADLELLKNIDLIKAINQVAEISWDGGLNIDNVSQIAAGGVDILVVGGSIQRAENPQLAYQELVHALGR